MKKDIILCGVGGQGILSIATIIGEAATEAGINLKQAEVHGMSQRGGDVQSNLRLSTEPIYSDLISLGGADVVISMEPMESLRYLPYLAKTGTIVTSNKPFVNIPDYPDETALMAEDDGLEFYKAIINNYTTSLKNGGMLLFEVGFSQSEKVAKLLGDAGYKNIEIKKDLNEIARAVSGIKGE